jgi:FlaA1/EpsC-like NDP-sugar epimerase
MAEDKGEFVGDFTQLPKDHYVTAIQFTKNVYQDIYPAVDPKKAELNLKGKTVVITGASRGIGKLVCFNNVCIERAARIATNR